MPSVDKMNRVVAFVDILGFQELVNEADRDAKLLESIYRTLQRIVEIKHVTNIGGLGCRELSPHLQATAFSDSIVISDSFDGFGFPRVVATAGLLAADLLRLGILCRGAFALGWAIHDDQILFGKGVVAAYQLERSVAVFPRLIFADDLVEAAQLLTFGRAKQDFDGVWYLDVFNQFNDVHQPAADVLPARALSQTPPVEILRGVRLIVVDGLKKYACPSITAKYRWLAMRFNEAVMEYTPGEVELLGVNFHENFLCNREDR